MKNLIIFLIFGLLFVSSFARFLTPGENPNIDVSTNHNDHPPSSNKNSKIVGRQSISERGFNSPTNVVIAQILFSPGSCPQPSVPIQPSNINSITGYKASDLCYNSNDDINVVSQCIGDTLYIMNPTFSSSNSLSGTSGASAAGVPFFFNIDATNVLAVGSSLSVYNINPTLSCGTQGYSSFCSSTVITSCTFINSCSNPEQPKQVVASPGTYMTFLFSSSPPNSNWRCKESSACCSSFSTSPLYTICPGYTGGPQ